MKSAIILIGACLNGIAIGLFLYLRPGTAIEIQRIFYKKINWRIEPISMPKEVRNTRVMGAFLFLLTLTAAIYILVKG